MNNNVGNGFDSEELANVTQKVIEKKSIQREILEWLLSILIAVVLAFVIRQFIFTIVKVEGPSMQPTLINNDRLVVWRLGYKPQNGDIIVLQKPGRDPYIKRIIATEGQSVYIDFDTHKVYVNGEELQENYILEPTRERGDFTSEVTVPDNCVFVMGDNRNNSRDSRSNDVGMVKREEILGKAVLRFFPFNSISVF